MATVVKPTQLSCLHNVEATTPIECLPNMLHINARRYLCEQNLRIDKNVMASTLCAG